MKETSRLTITISRQLGSGGSYLGYITAKELGFKYIDREILRQAAERFGTDAGALAYMDERSPDLLETVMKGFSFGMPEMSVAPLGSPPIYHKELFNMECRIMNEIADRYNAVIVGRGGFYALKNRSDVLRLFVYAPEEFRVKRIMEAQDIKEFKEVKNKVKESDQRRAKFIRDMTGTDWMDSRNYQLCIDSSIFEFSEIASLIIKAVKKKSGYPLDGNEPIA